MSDTDRSKYLQEAVIWTKFTSILI
jgi:hypothetical protein